MSQHIEELSSQVTSVARDAWASASDAIDRIKASLTPASGTSSSLERLVRPPLERGAAALRWAPLSPIGSSAVVPLPAPSLDDPRMLLSVLTLARVLYTEMEEHQRLQQQEAGGSGQSLGWPLPPVTCALTTAAVWRYFNPVLLKQVCLSPYCVVERHEAGRLWSSCLTHLDAPHLLSNLAALLPDAADLERAAGLPGFAVDVAAMATLSSGLFVCWAVLEKEVLRRPTTYFAVGAVGLSSLAFALQVVRGEAQRGRPVLLLGVLPVPAQFSWAAQLGLTVLAAPSSSFAGHMCGVLAGIAHVYLVRPVLRALLASGSPSTGPTRTDPRPTPRFYGSGTLSGRPMSGRSTAGGSSGGGGGDVLRVLRGAGAQLALAAATVAVYVVASSRVRGGQRGTVSDWRLR